MIALAVKENAFKRTSSNRLDLLSATSAYLKGRRLYLLSLVDEALCWLALLHSLSTTDQGSSIGD
jgi:hypothetical protein